MSVGTDRGRVRPGWKWFWFRFCESVESESVWKFGPTLFLLGLCVPREQMCACSSAGGCGQCPGGFVTRCILLHGGFVACVGRTVERLGGVFGRSDPFRLV